MLADMTHYLKLAFVGRECPVVLPVPEEDAQRLSRFLQSPDDYCRFVELSTIFGQVLWINLQNIRFVHFLHEDCPITDVELSAIAPPGAVANEEECEFMEGLWNVHVWISEEKGPLSVLCLPADEWEGVTHALQDRDRFCKMTDEDGEPIAIAVSSVDLLVGTEPARYPEYLLGTIEREIIPSPLEA